MKALKITLYCSFFALFLFVSTGTGMVSQSAQELNGTWSMIKYKQGKDQDLTEVPQVIKYVKYISDRHFGWASYGENGNVIGAGGGTYKLTNNTYTEIIDYFHPHGANLAGSSVTFHYKMEGNDWTISGFAKNIQLNPGTGEYEMVDSVFLEEVWRKL